MLYAVDSNFMGGIIEYIVFPCFFLGLIESAVYTSLFSAVKHGS